MGRYIIRRALFAIPTLIAISFIIFLILDLAPGDPTAQLPLTIPPDVRERLRESLGMNDPMFLRWLKWMFQFFIVEPINMIEQIFGITIGDSENRTRILSWSSRGPVVDVIIERIPQTLWVLGLAFVFGIVIAIPVAFLFAGAVGIAIERGIIRWLYGRPLETLLATWGVSLILIQAVRLGFGAANVAVANPSWLSGAAERARAGRPG